MSASRPRSTVMNGVSQHPQPTTFKHTDNRRKRGAENVGKVFRTIDFNSFDISVLRKYARVHNIDISSRASKDDLVDAVSRDFVNQEEVDEIETITCFLYTARYRESVLRLPLQM